MRNRVAPTMWGRFLLMGWIIPFFALFGSPRGNASVAAFLWYWGAVLSLLLLLDLAVAPLALFRWRTRAPRSIEVREDRVIVRMGLLTTVLRELPFEHVLGVNAPPSKRLALGGLHVLASRDWSKLRTVQSTFASDYEASPINLYLTPPNARAVRRARARWRKDHPPHLASDDEARERALTAASAGVHESPGADGWISNHRRDRTYPSILWGVATVMAALFAFMGALAAQLYGLSGFTFAAALALPALLAYASIGGMMFLASRKWIGAVKVNPGGLGVRKRSGAEIAVQWDNVSRLLPEDNPSPDWALTYKDSEGPQLMAVSASIARAILQCPSCPARVFAPRKRAEKGDMSDIEEMFGREVAEEAGLTSS